LAVWLFFWHSTLHRHIRFPVRFRRGTLTHVDPYDAHRRTIESSVKPSGYRAGKAGEPKQGERTKSPPVEQGTGKPCLLPFRVPRSLSHQCTTWTSVFGEPVSTD
jgi:hypothetical protein